jgi:hypothetical protein
LRRRFSLPVRKIFGISEPHEQILKRTHQGTFLQKISFLGVIVSEKKMYKEKLTPYAYKRPWHKVQNKVDKIINMNILHNYYIYTDIFSIKKYLSIKVNVFNLIILAFYRKSINHRKLCFTNEREELTLKLMFLIWLFWHFYRKSNNHRKLCFTNEREEPLNIVIMHCFHSTSFRSGGEDFEINFNILSVFGHLELYSVFVFRSKLTNLTFWI